MVDRPILFSAPMIRALLDGRKTQTRVILDRFRSFALPDIPAATFSGADAARALLEAADFRHIEGDAWEWTAKAFDYQAPATRTHWFAHLSYAPGDRLWVREAWRTESRAYDDLKPSDLDADYPVLYGADADWTLNKSVGRYRHARFMLRWASRLTLIVESVKVERLQDISEADAACEGVAPNKNHNGRFSLSPHDDASDATARDTFMSLWESIHGIESWWPNPWVVAISFRVVKANIDTIDIANRPLVCEEVTQ